MTARELLGDLGRKGCAVVRQSGSHAIVRCGTCQTVVPIHRGDIPKGTLASIKRDLKPCLGEDWL